MLGDAVDLGSAEPYWPLVPLVLPLLVAERLLDLLVIVMDGITSLLDTAFNTRFLICEKARI